MVCFFVGEVQGTVNVWADVEFLVAEMLLSLVYFWGESPGFGHVEEHGLRFSGVVEGGVRSAGERNGLVGTVGRVGVDEHGRISAHD